MKEGKDRKEKEKDSRVNTFYPVLNVLREKKAKKVGTKKASEVFVMDDDDENYAIIHLLMCIWRMEIWRR